MLTVTQVEGWEAKLAAEVQRWESEKSRLRPRGLAMSWQPKVYAGSIAVPQTNAAGEAESVLLTVWATQHGLHATYRAHFEYPSDAPMRDCAGGKTFAEVESEVTAWSARVIGAHRNGPVIDRDQKRWDEYRAWKAKREAAPCSS